jgi:hypothetical protein
VTVAFPGRNFTNRGDHYEISLSDDYITTLLTETNLQDCKPAPAPGTPALNTATANHDQPLSTEEHAQYGRAVGKLQRMTCTSTFSSTLKKEQSTTSRRFQRSTTGLLITLHGTTISDGSRTQATIALSSAEAELYAINTGAAEAHNKISIKIHTDAP